MRLRLKDSSRVPYGGGFVLARPDLGFVGKGLTFLALAESVRAYRKANGIPIGLGFIEELEQVVCATYQFECYQETPANLPSPYKLGITDVLRGTQLMALHKLAGSPLESQAEADRRAAICASCPMRVDVTMPCPGICATMQNAVKAIIGAAKTASDVHLNGKGCAICKCWIGAMVWVPLDIQWSVLSEEQKEQFRVAKREFGCWKCVD